MPAAYVAPFPVFKAWDNAANPLAGGLVYQYAAGTATPAATYTDSTASQQNANPLTLNSRGEANIWWAPGVGIKLVVTDSSGNQISSTDQLYTGSTTASGSFTVTGVGFTVAPIVTVNWFQVGSLVVATIGAFIGTSNSNSFSLTGVPVALQPPTLLQYDAIAYAENNGAAAAQPSIQITPNSSSWNFLLAGSGSAWTPSGIKGIPNGSIVITYLLL